MVSEYKVVFVYLCCISVENFIRLHLKYKFCNELSEKYQNRACQANKIF